jgi:two-component system alkaline phosphatase synthesis response regulator PhoP
MNSERILVVDDDPDIVRLVRGYLEKAGFRVLTAFDGASALHLLRVEQPDLIILDLMLPDWDGWEITRRIRADSRLAALPIIMLTARVDDADKILGLELGADDYMTKPFNPREVVARVRARLRRSQPGGMSQSPITETGPLRLDRARREVTVSGRAVDLTPTEFNLLTVFMERPGVAFTRSELIERALGYEYLGMERTLDSHIKNLRRKIEPDTRTPRFIETVFGVGYRLVGIEGDG